MKKLLLMALPLLVLAGGCKRKEVTTVQTTPVERHTVTEKVSATGKIQPEAEVKISPEVSGEIIQLTVKEGEQVKAGQLLVKIKPDAYQAQREQIVASLSGARAQASGQQASLVGAQQAYQRTKELAGKGLAAQAELDQAKSQFDQAQAQLNAARFTVQQTEANLRRVTEDLNKTAIYAPRDGTVSQLNVELGERVVGTSQMAGTVMMTIADLTQMEARVNVNENDVVRVSVGDTAKIEVDAYPNRPFKGIVREIANTAQTAGQGTQEQVTNFEVRIRVLAEDAVFRPGMSTTADIETETKPNVLTVPIQAVTARMPEAPGKPTATASGDAAASTTDSSTGDTGPAKMQQVVFILDGTTVKQVPVETGISDDSNMEVTGGLKGGETIITGPYRAVSRELKEGATVKVDNKTKRGGANGESAGDDK